MAYYRFLSKKAMQAMTPAEHYDIWKQCSQDCMEYLKQGKYASYRSTRLFMADFRKNEEAYRDSIALLTEVLLWDNMGCVNDMFRNELWYISFFVESTFPKEGKYYLVAPAVARLLELCKKHLKWTDAELKAGMLKAAEPITLPYMPYTNAESVELYFLFRKQDYEGIEKIVRRAKRRTKQKFPQKEFEEYKWLWK